MQILKKITMLAFLMAAFTVGATAQLTGTKNVPGDYATVAAAVTDLNTQGVGAGGVTFVVADGYTETAPAGGFAVNNPTGNGAGNPIVFRRGGTGGARPTFTANAALTSGSLTDAIFKIIGTDNLTIDGFSMSENAANTTTAAGTNNMTEFGVALFYATPTNGSQNVTIQNCIIDLDRTYQNTFGIYSNSTHSATSVSATASATTTDGGNGGLKLYSNSITDINIGIVVVGPTAAADQNDGLDIGGTAQATGNSVTNYGTTGTFSSYANVSGTVNGILVRNTRNYNVSYNSVVSSNGSTTAGTLRGIYVPSFTNAPTGTIVNSINNNSISVRSGVLAGTLQGIIVEATTVNATTTQNFNNNDFSNTTHTIAAATGAITLLSNAGFSLSQNINNNTFTNLIVNTTGSVTFISNSVTLPTGGTQSVSGNSIVTEFNKTGAGGTVTVFTTNASSVAGTVVTNNNNNFSNITVTGATAITGWSNTDGGSPTKTVSGNTFINWTGGTGAIIGMNVSFSGAATVSNNIVGNITGGGAITGISTATGGTTAADNFSQNTIYGLSGAGTGAVTGILNTSGTTRNIFRNKIYNLENTNAGGTANGITVSGGTTIGVYNNLVGDLRATAATSATTPVATDAVRGINITSTTATTTINVSFNTVYLNATSTGANFSTSALFATTGTTATTATLNARNNIFVNLSTRAGTGIAAAFRRSSTALDNYGAVSNNNDFFAGTPSATRLIFYDGSNSDQTLAAYKSRVAPRDSVSVTENPNFVSTTGANANYLHISTATPTQLESGGTPIAGITDDYDGETRNASTPDIGADEFNGAAIDGNPPTISYTAFGNTTSTDNRTIAVTITDASGVAGGANSPRIYFRKNGGAYSSTQCVSTGGSGYNCTIDYSLIGGVTANDQIDYFVVAQDVNGNVGATPSAGFSATSVNNITSPPTTPNTYRIVNGFAASVNVGAGETYTSLTNAGGVFEALNAGVLTGNVTINLTTDLTGETGAVALNQQTEEGSGAGTYTVTIKPSGAARTITGTTANLIKLNGADRVTIDGALNGGTDRSLTINNTSTSTSGYGVWIASVNATNGALNDTVKNCIVNGNAPTTTFVGLVSSGSALGGIAETANTGTTFQNNAITAVQYGIAMVGPNGNETGNSITGNTIGSATAASKIGFNGIAVFQQANMPISRNSIVGVTTATTSTTSGIRVAGSSSGVTVSRNMISDVKNTNATGYGANGIQLNSSATAANVTVVNNFVSDVAGIGFNGVGLADNGYGIVVASGGGYNIYFNSVNLATSETTADNITGAVNILAAVTTAASIDLRDNVLVNTETVGTRYAVINASTQAAAVFTDINYNDYFAQNVGRQGTTAYATLADWQAATGKDANSKAVDPLFVSATDLHLQSTSPLVAMATPIAGITTDIDGDTRDAVPDIGADEIVNFVAPTVQFSAANYTGAEGTSATVTVTRTGDTSAAGTVNYATSDGTATGGTACGTSGVDYQTTAGTLSFAAGEMNQTFAVVLCSDSVIKGNETINLTLSAPTGATLGTPSTATLTITNVNPPMPGTVALSASTYSVGEASGTVTVTVNRSNGTDGAVAVNYTLTDGTATGGATCAAGVDFINTGGTLNFASGQSSRTINVTICDDSIFEGSENFSLDLSNPTGGATIGTPISTTVTIIDDETAQNGSVQFSAAAYSVSEAGPTATITITRTGGSDGSVTVGYATVAGGTATGGTTCATGVDYITTTGTATFNSGVTTQTFTIPICNDTVVEQSETVNLALSNATGGATLGSPNTAVLTITDDDIAGLNGSYNVGAGEIYTSLTNAGGAFEALNTSGATGNVTFNITSDLTGETGAVALNEVTGGYTVTIKPTGAARTISGTSAASSGVIVLNGADNVTIDGSLNGGTDRSLTITNATVAATVIWIRSASATNGATGDTVKNTNIAGAGTANSTGGVLSGSSTFGSAAAAPNSNNTIQNNAIIKVQNALFLSGNATTFDQNWMIVGNTFGSTTAAEKLSFRGMLLGGANNFTITRNTITGISSATTSTSTMTGIQLSANATNGLVTRNNISDIKQNNTGGYGANGVYLAQTSTTANVTVANNFIRDVAGVGFNGVGAADNGYGIVVASGGGYKIYFNSVNLATNETAAGSITGAVNILAAVTTAASIDLRDNILVNTETVGTRYAVINSSTPGAAVFAGTDYNDYFAQNVGRSGTTTAINYPTLTDYRAFTGKDASSQAVDPLFVSATDLHLQTTSPVLDDGTPIAEITDDIDGDTRSTTTPDIGADEIVGMAPQSGTLALSASTYTVSEAATSVTITVNRTNGTSGAVAVNYTLGGGTATGGATCAAGVDYINTGGTVNFADGQATQTFSVTLCPDSLNKADETFNVTLSGATGGATIGTPSTATVTIINDDPLPTITINDVSQNEGNSGTTAFNFTLTLSAVSGQAVTVDYATADGTATAGSDYTAVNGTVTFAPGETSKQITVSVNGDTTVEANETFFVNLTNATNAAIADNQGIGTIINDDTTLGSFTINDVRVRETDNGTVNAVFTVTLTNPNGQASAVNYATADGTATAGSDYVATSGVLNFGAGETTKTITVVVNGDLLKESNEFFYVNLSNPVNAVIGDGQGVGIIIDNDRAIRSDFDKDGKTDFSVFRPSNGTWYVLRSETGLFTYNQFGTSGDVAAPGDYDGDGAADLAVFRPSNGTWYVRLSSTLQMIQRQFGTAGDIPVQGDFNGDGKTDIAVFRPSNGTWYSLPDINGSGYTQVQFGTSGDVPVQGDYDGDSKTDYAVYRGGNWYVLNSATNTVTGISYGLASDKPLVGDFDGDGRADFTVYRDGVWYIFQTLTGTSRAVSFGTTEDIPAPGDYDGDGTSDIAVFRPSMGRWYVLQSSNGGFVTAQFGQSGDVPLPRAYQPIP